MFPLQCANAIRDIGKALERKYGLGLRDLRERVPTILPLPVVEEKRLQFRRASYSSNYHMNLCLQLLGTAGAASPIPSNTSNSGSTITTAYTSSADETVDTVDEEEREATSKKRRRYPSKIMYPPTPVVPPVNALLQNPATQMVFGYKNTVRT